jgi:hypothetical protein
VQAKFIRQLLDRVFFLFDKHPLPAYIGNDLLVLLFTFLEVFSPGTYESPVGSDCRWLGDRRLAFGSATLAWLPSRVGPEVTIDRLVMWAWKGSIFGDVETLWAVEVVAFND